MKKRSKKSPNDYPRFTFRIDPTLRARLAEIERVTGLNPSRVTITCLNNHLPVIEERHGITRSVIAKAA